MKSGRQWNVKGSLNSALEFVSLSVEVGIHSYLERDFTGWILAELTVGKNGFVRQR
jgi:hypothetical protein